VPINEKSPRRETRASFSGRETRFELATSTLARWLSIVYEYIHVSTKSVSTM